MYIYWDTKWHIWSDNITKVMLSRSAQSLGYILNKNSKYADIMQEKLSSIYDFLIENRAYNKELQEKYYKSLVLSHNNIEDKITSLLYEIANTQSQPKIDNLSKFYRFIYEDQEALTSFQKFVERISNKASVLYYDLYHGLKNCDGRGPKTSALFVKTMFHLHNKNYDARLKLWRDAPVNISANDCLFLPVDSVIIAIFKKIENKSWTFTSINKEISKYYNGNEIEVWDDLWFWGFITQKVENKERILEWNPNKYWSMNESNKDPIVIKTIEEKSKIFLSLLI